MTRLRILIDTMVDESAIPRLAELIADQPACTVSIATEAEGIDHVLGGRFVGAQQVYVDAQQ